MRSFWRRLPLLVKFLVVIVGIVAYLNVGYLIAYSIDGAAKPTAFSETIYKIVDFGAAGGKALGRDNLGIEKDGYVVFTIIWPILLIAFWVVNFASLGWKICVWLITGGIFRWLDWIK